MTQAGIQKRIVGRGERATGTFPDTLSRKVPIFPPEKKR
jgi:hypothetical protein